MYLVYYVYAYLRKSDLTPYYIGKGKDKRAYAKDHAVGMPPDKSRIVFLETNLTDVGACALERRMIKWYGRKDNGTGILRNKTDGGDGNSGGIASAITKARISKAKSGKAQSAQHRANISSSKKDIPFTDAHKAAIKQSHTDNPRPPRYYPPMTAECRAKMSANTKLRLALKKTVQSTIVTS